MNKKKHKTNETISKYSSLRQRNGWWCQKDKMQTAIVMRVQVLAKVKRQTNTTIIILRFTQALRLPSSRTSLVAWADSKFVQLRKANWPFSNKHAHSQKTPHTLADLNICTRIHLCEYINWCSGVYSSGCGRDYCSAKAFQYDTLHTFPVS